MIAGENCDRVMHLLAQKLILDNNSPLYRDVFFDSGRLDFSISSLEHVESCISRIKNKKYFIREYNITVLRLGAYTGEVIRTSSNKNFHWYSYETVSMNSKFLQSAGLQLSTKNVLYSEEYDEMIFPLGKIIKYIENGGEESLAVYAGVIINEIQSSSMQSL